MSYLIQESVNSLLLPITSGQGEEFLKTVLKLLEKVGVDVADQSEWISLELKKWKLDGKPSKDLKTLISSALFNSKQTPKTFIFQADMCRTSEALNDCAANFSKNYFKCHSELVQKHFFDHESARQLLSHFGLISRLRLIENMTASEISRLIAIRDNRFSLNWLAIAAILKHAKILPKLLSQDVIDQYESDKSNEALLFGDLSIVGAIDKIASSAVDLGCPGEFSQLLQAIFIDDLHPPYLLLLHYQLLIQSKFDHAISYAYEFKPRGQLATWLTEKYVAAGIPVKKNAFLNNAKATLKFDRAWATGRSDSKHAANSLADIFDQMENLGVLAKNELSFQIRCLLHRYLRVTSEEAGGVVPNLLPVLDKPELQEILAHIGQGNTGTTGILEQRLVDAYSSLLHNLNDGWREKGVGDSVFAANFFRKKFGDTEFVSANGRELNVVAYESHGGKLSSLYLFDHIDTFKNVLDVRREEIEVIADLNSCKFKVIFVAHAFAEGLPNSVELADGSDHIRLSLEYVSFNECIEQLLLLDRAVVVLNELLVSKLNDKFVHPLVREKVLNFIS